VLSKCHQQDLSSDSLLMIKCDEMCVGGPGGHRHYDHDAGAINLIGYECYWLHGFYSLSLSSSTCAMEDLEETDVMAMMQVRY
jgi:hypothetical protein